MPPAKTATKRSTAARTKRAKKEPSPEPDVDYDAMKLPELKKACEEKGLDTNGKKADLLRRLKSAEADQDEDEPEAKVQKVDEAEDVDYDAMTLAELKKACADKGLDTKGKKTDLVQRLKSGKAGQGAEVDDVDTKIKQAMKAIQSEGPKQRKNIKVDDRCTVAPHVEVCQDYDCMLNQTNIGFNNNKYYVIQLLQSKNAKNPLYWTWNRWGRVGEPGATALKTFGNNLQRAEADFKKKFKDKTKNDWDNRQNFTPYPQKYTLLEMDDDDDDEEEETQAKPSGSGNVKTKPCSLDPAVKELMELIFDTDMFNNAMMSMNLDLKKMPLGKLSKQQIAKGFDVLVELEDAIKAKKGIKSYEAISSKFYTLIPHDFKRSRPAPLTTIEQVQEKKDMLIVLSDIEVAQGMKREQEKQEESERESQELPPHPLDVKYEMLKCDLRRLDPKDEMFKIIETYKKETSPNMKLPIVNAYEMVRQPEVSRFKAFDKLDNRKLLWHGTKVAVVAAILKGGLRIMPHSGGRVGRGIYFASENSKSAGYVGPSGGWFWGGQQNTGTKNIGIMFLAEVALGKEKTLLRDDGSLEKAPPGFDSVVARGYTEPDPKKNITRKMDGKDIVIPQGKPIPTEFDGKSSFSQSEYLVYDEAQVRLRYLLELDYNQMY